MEQEKIIKLLEFLTTDASIETSSKGITIKNSQYSTNIQIEGLPDWNYKVEFGLRTDSNPFKELGKNKGESFVLPFSIMQSFLQILTEELNIQENKRIINEWGHDFFNKKRKEILNILNSEIKIEEEYQNYTLSCKQEIFNNVMTIEKPENEKSILTHDFIKLRYTYLVPNVLVEDNEKDYKYKTQSISLLIPAIEIKNYKILSRCFVQPIKNDYSSLLDILNKNNQDDKMKKLLLYTKLDVELDIKQNNIHKIKTTKI